MQLSYTFHNCGAFDVMSCPGLYFDLGVIPSHVDFREYREGDVIFGGGGLLQGGMDGAFQNAVAQNGIIKILWGAGLNIADGSPWQYPEWLKEFDLVGLRDFGTPYEYVPCASCMHPLFDECRENLTDSKGTVAIDHFQYKIPLPISAFDTWLDYPKWWEFEKVVRTIAAASLVVTRSYHACYYAMILQKAVICFQPWSSKFKLFGGIEPTFCYDLDIKSAALEAVCAPSDYLDECRNRNREFAQKVKDLIYGRNTQKKD